MHLSSILTLNYSEKNKPKPKLHQSSTTCFLKTLRKGQFGNSISKIKIVHSISKPSNMAYLLENVYQRFYFTQQVFAKFMIKCKLCHLVSYVLSLRSSENIKSRTRALASAHERMSSWASYCTLFCLWKIKNNKLVQFVLSPGNLQFHSPFPPQTLPRRWSFKSTAN